MPSRASEMAQQGFTVNSAKAANGEVVHINDHVYVSSPWSDRDGTPYIIARILDFLPPGAAKVRGSSKQPANELHVRLSLYYRPSDISGRSVSDFRLLLAAIHTIVEPITVVRGRCYVRHRDKIEDLIKWKHTPDHFYFVKFFDPYIKREYEVLRTANVNNIPPHVKEVLLTRYEYLLVEKEMVADLMDAYKSCAICNQWAASQNSVRCELCKQFYHMQCLTPPLLAKPAKGYSWGCLACTIQRRKDVESEKYRFVSNGGSAPTPKGKTVTTKQQKKLISEAPDVMFRGWPWRYFGLYTRAEDTLNPEDLIFPRSVTRVGIKYQANVPTLEEQADGELVRQENIKTTGMAAPDIYERGFDPGETTLETTITLICKPSDDLTNYMEDEMRLSMPVPPYDVRRMNMAVESYTAMGSEAALQHMQSRKLADFNPIEWTPEETEVFERDLEKNGGLDAWSTGKTLGKRPAEVLRFSYMWKNKKLRTENELIRQHRKVHAAHARNNNRTLGAPSLGKIRSRAESETSDDEGSLYNASFVAVNRMQCAACSTRTSNVWWKCPRTLQGNAMCESCGSNYRKYGVISFVKSEDAKRVEKKDPKGRRGKETGSGTSTPVPTAAPKLPPCVCCRKMEPKASLMRCKTCTFSAHAACYGIPPEELGPDWECELCANVRKQEINLNPRCLLCPRDNTNLTARIKNKRAPVDFDLLSVLKPTEGCQWAHVLCSAVIPEVQFTHGSTFKAVEGISTIADAQWDSFCTLCLQQDGATIPCTECGTDLHPSCAWLASFRIGFQFTTVKGGKRDAGNVARFKDSVGIMTPGVWCKGHDLEGKVIYDMFEVDPELGQNALQVYVSTYKTVPATESFALLRKAQRLDVVEDRVADRRAADRMDVHINGDTKPALPACTVCGIDVSPRWHGSGPTLRCHQCSFATGNGVQAIAA